VAATSKGLVKVVGKLEVMLERIKVVAGFREDNAEA
jgi:hypothetical protein